MSNRDITLGNLATTTPNTVIETSIGYSGGGYNYFHGTENPRGFYVSATIWKIENGFRSTVLGTGGLRRHLEPAKRFSSKRLEQLASEARDSSTTTGVQLAELVARVAANAGLTIAPLTTIAHAVSA